jgi:hypothetical protein
MRIGVVWTSAVFVIGLLGGALASPNFTLAPFSGRSVAASGAPPPGSSVVECACASNLFVDDATGSDSDGAGCEGLPLKTISAAVQCALPTATITLQPGTFVGGNISVVNGSVLTIVGRAGVVIDGNRTRTFDIGPGAVVSFTNIEFTNGHAVEVEAGVSSCAIPIRDSCPGRFGGALRVTNAEVVCDMCTFKLNTAMCGGAVSVSKSNATFNDCSFENNGGLPNDPPYAL